MKMCIAATGFLAVLVVAGCEPAVTFDKPQPEGVKPLAFFPKDLQEKYADTGHISTLIITANLISRHYDFDLKKSIDSLGSSYQIVNDTLINLEDGTKEKIVLKEDTVFKHIDWTDTLFNISADNVLKKFKGYYFLNNRYYENAWEVKKLSLNKGVLLVSSIAEKNDIEKLEEISGTTTDTLPANFSLTKKQFKKFVRQKGFGDEEIFIRITTSDK